MAEGRIHNLQDSPQWRENCLQLLQREFPKGEKCSEAMRVEDEFALLLDPPNFKRVFVKVLKEKVVATASYKCFDVRVPGCQTPLPCAGVGLVVTDPEYRGQGHAHELQQHIDQEASAENAVLSILWSDLHDFYMKQGYLASGAEYHWIVEKKDIEALRDSESTMEIRPLLEFSNEAQELYEKESWGPQRDWTQYNKLLQLSDTFGAAAYKDGKLQAYALMGKGRDLRDTVHEFMGNPHSLLPILQNMFESMASQQVRVQLPAQFPLKTSLSENFGPPELSALAFMKVLNPLALLTWINRSGVLGVSLELVDNGDSFRVKKDDKDIWGSTDAGHLLQLFFGPWRPASLNLPQSLKQALEGIKPVRFYFWGFDSV